MSHLSLTVELMFNFESFYIFAISFLTAMKKQGSHPQISLMNRCSNLFPIMGSDKLQPQMLMVMLTSIRLSVFDFPKQYLQHLV